MSRNEIKKVFVGLSGGVDSSVAAYLLKKQGYDVTGVFIRSFNIDGCEERDAEDARRVAEHLGIPFYVFDFEKEYKKKVVEYMVQGYKHGITPNPDVMCNKEIKFGLFLKKARAMGADYVATGHYALLRRNPLSRTGRSLTPAVSTALRSRPQNFRSAKGQAFAASESFSQEDSGSFSLFEGVDKNKDQSYFLWTLTQDQLKFCLFPIGKYAKPKVREIARKAGLPTAEKKDSQGICFLGEVELGEFLKRYIKPKKGSVIDTDGKKVGEHDGVFFYTVGQRHGLGLGGGEPYYITEKILKTNTIVVARGSNNPALFRKEVEIASVNFILPSFHRLLATHRQFSVFARIRYRQPLVKATLELGPPAGGWNKPARLASQYNAGGELGVAERSLVLKFDEPVKFVAPGQSAVFYSRKGSVSAKASADMEMLGGGIIV